MTKQAKIILFCCLYISGIVTFFSEYTLIISFAVFVVLFIAYYKKVFSYKYFFVLLLVFLFAFVNVFSHLKYDDELTSYADEDISAEAKVSSIPSNNKQDKTVFYAKITGIKADNIEQKHIAAKTLVTIAGEKEKLKEIKIGDLLTFKARVKVPANSQNPSQFDYAKYLQYRNVFTLLYVKQDEWRIKSRADDILGMSLSKLNDVRNKIIAIHSKNIQSPQLEILGGIIFGDDAVNPDEDTKTAFINSGIFHILAASGMNVTLIFGIWLFLAKSLRFNYRFSIIAGMALIIFYTCMTGFGPPIIRASLMLIFILLGKLLDRKASTMSLLFFVGFLMLAYNPLMLFDIGFQLSFIVTFALILTSPLIVFNFKYKILNYILGSCMIPLVAQIYASPLQMYYFNTMAIYSVPANIAIIPVLSIVSFAGFISSIIALIPALAYKICYCADLILKPLLFYITNVANFFSELPYSIIHLEKPSFLQVFVYFTIIILVTCILRYKLFSKRVYIALSVLVIIFFASLFKLPEKNMEIMFFSVGNADAIMLKLPNNEYFLIDSGKYNYMAANSQAKNIIIKYLRDKGIKRINSYIITHFDSDHAGGSIDILKYLDVENVYLSDIFENTKLSGEIIDYIKDNKNKCTKVYGTVKIYKDKDTEINIIRPSGELIKTENQNSLITHCRYKGKNFLFMGDGDINSYNALPENFKSNISIIKSGHHGALNTVNTNMAINSEIFVISTGKNIYNHPHPKTIDVIENNDRKYIRTDYYNAIDVKINKDAINVYSYSPKKNKFVKIY